MIQEQKKITPLMQQYFDIKQKFSDALLFFQVGDFYELFFDDAKQAAHFLGIALTKRGTHENDPIPLCGVPIHASDFYISKLVRGGFKVVLCDQLEEAQPGKVVQRGVRQVFTPGTLTDSKLLDDKTASYLCVVYKEDNSFQIVFAELLTGKLYLTVVGDEPALEAELARFSPDEVVTSHANIGRKVSSIIKQRGYFVTEIAEIVGEKNNKNFENWYKQLVVNDGVRTWHALRMLYHYLITYHTNIIQQCRHVQIYGNADFLLLDAATQKNLELVKNNVDGTSKFTLFSVLDHASTPMGSRTIKKWLLRPLLNQKKIEARLKVVTMFLDNDTLRQQLQTYLKSVGDLERIIGRLSLDRASLQDFVCLRNALAILPQIVITLQNQGDELFDMLTQRIANFSDLFHLLSVSINDDPEKNVLIKTGFDRELDRLRLLSQSATHAIADLEKREQGITNINSLKIRFSSVHGYYIEITKTHFAQVPERYQRVQTLVGRERFTTPELKELERDVQRAHNEIDAIEKEIYNRVKAETATYLSQLQKATQVLAHLDALAGFAQAAYLNNYSRPHFNDHHDIIIEDGRHPVVERLIDTSYIPNSVTLTQEAAMWIITGPNMGGKSTFLRQVALSCIMAQSGCYVPARTAYLAIVDRIFTRIGASDKVSQGKSTFLVEMEETALICKQATKRSLVILDEVGRGTSTFDGLAIAQAVVEFLHNDIGVRGLFATHYHELADLEKKHPGIVTFHAASKRHEKKLIFLYKIVQGNADGSFGIDVAELAHLPNQVILRAREILSSLI